MTRKQNSLFILQNFQVATFIDDDALHVGDTGQQLNIYHHGIRNLQNLTLNGVYYISRFDVYTLDFKYLQNQKSPGECSNDYFGSHGKRNFGWWQCHQVIMSSVLAANIERSLLFIDLYLYAAIFSTTNTVTMLVSKTNIVYAFHSIIAQWGNVSVAIWIFRNFVSETTIVESSIFIHFNINIPKALCNLLKDSLNFIIEN